MKISIIIPIYGVEKYIAQCARSLFNQSETNLEFIFVNDATKDHSIEILREVISKEYSNLQEQIIIIDKPVNEGLPQARKTGVNRATGDYIMHCDSDDWIAADAITSIVKKIEDTSADIIYYNYYISTEEHDEIRNEDVFFTPEEYMKAIISFSKKSGAYCWNKVIKRKFYDLVETWPTENMHEDIGLMPQIIYHTKTITFIEKPLYHYRCSSTSSMSINYNKNVVKRTQSKANHLILINFLEKHKLINSFHKQYQQLISRCAYNAAFFDKSSIVKELPVYRSIWRIPLFWNFDVSIRRQLQSRLVISYYFIKNRLSFFQ